MKKAIALATASLSNFEDPSQRRVLNNLQVIPLHANPFYPTRPEWVANP